MDSSFIVVAKSVMENSQKIAAMEIAIKATHPEMYAIYAEKLAEFAKTNEAYFQKMNEALERLKQIDEEGKSEN